MKKLLATLALAVCASFGVSGVTINLSSWSGGTHTLNDGDIATGTLAGNCKITIAAGATVTISNATINGVNNSTYAWAGLTCNGNATIILSGENYMYAYHEDYPGIYVPEGCTLTIRGSGSLRAMGGGLVDEYNNVRGGGAGIGGGNAINCGNIVIEGGTITALGKSYAAGIGCGNGGSCGNITIRGGTVTATGSTQGGAGIGSAFALSTYSATCGDITIEGGTVNATGSTASAGIGAGNLGRCGNIAISGGTVTATGTGAGIGAGNQGRCGNITFTGGETTATSTDSASGSAGVGCGYQAICDAIAISGGILTATGAGTGAGIGTGGSSGTAHTGAITVSGSITRVVATRGEDCTNNPIGAGSSGGYTGTVTVQTGLSDKTVGQTRTIQWSGNLNGITFSPTAGDGTVITGTRSVSCLQVNIAPGATVRLRDATLDASLRPSSIGLNCLGDATIILEGSNYVKGAAGYPGIYVPAGSLLTVKGSGILSAYGGLSAAGIGGSYSGSDYENSGRITIDGGVIYAKGGGHAAGIGSGVGGHSDAIRIEEHAISVTAQSGSSGNPIGKGKEGSVASVTVDSSLNDDHGTPVRTITSPRIWDGNLDTLTDDDALALDGTVIHGTLGEQCKISIADGATVTLSNATITCGSNSSDYDWAGLTCEGRATIILKEENHVKGFYQNYPGIFVPAGRTLTIAGDGSLTASSSGNGAGIGGGWNLDCGNIRIEGGVISATGGSRAAGIGGGGTSASPGVACGSIEIVGGDVFAQGGGSAAGIGGGNYGTCGNITVGAGIVRVKAQCYGSCPPIGAGSSGSCGTVTVDPSLADDVSSTSVRIITPENWDGNLSTLTRNAKALDGKVVYGTLGGNYKVSIAAGATVTLSNVVINADGSLNGAWAGITCLGDATIILADGSANIVKAFNTEYPGIFVPQGYTLTIQGAGALTASAKNDESWGAGIGGGCTTGFSPIRCGSISIEGGSVTAIGGVRSAGIGSAYKGSCGDITIGAGITRVVATRGSVDDGLENQVAAIGAGLSSECGTVTIDPSLNDNNGNPTRTITGASVWNGNLATLDDDVTIESDMMLYGELAGQYKISIADGVTVTLNNAIITNGENNSSYSWAGLNCQSNATIILAPGSANFVKGFYEDWPGIYVPSNKTLTISGTGSLDASSNGYGAGIGGGNGISCGSIVIEGGTITAVGGRGSAGIGSGSYYSVCGDITISGGTVTASNSYDSVGIGSGINGRCGDIRITGGSVTAIAGRYGYGAGIGCGNPELCSGVCGNIYIGAGITRVLATSADYMPISEEDPAGVYCGTVTIDPSLTDDDGSPTRTITSAPSPWNGNLTALTDDVTIDHNMTLYGELAGPYKISIADGVTVTLNNAIITNGLNNSSYSWAGLNCQSNATIILAPGSANFVKGFYEDWPGIYVPSNKTLTISGTGSLDASSNGYGAGIGGGWNISGGNIIISGGTVTATGGKYAAGIGAGGNVSCGDITFTGGDVTATGGESANGIGAGNRNYIGTITIGAGIVRIAATRGENGNKPIGVGVDDTYVTVDPSLSDTTSDDGNTRTITAALLPWNGNLATLTDDVTIESDMTLYGELAELVKISIADGVTVTLDNAIITNGVNDSSYPWAGLTCDGDATIVLAGDSENFVKGFYDEHPGIYVPVGATLTIKGSGTLTARSPDTYGNYYAAGIGGGYRINCGSIVIDGGTVNATGGSGIGSGQYATCDGIVISNGTLVATGEQHSSGIGAGGYNSGCGNILITGGNVTARGGSYAAGIGTGDYESYCGNISITGGRVTATGGSKGAGIGSGDDSSSCGTITIGAGIVRVEATCGSDAVPIGKGGGSSASCGTVTVASGLSDDDDSPTRTITGGGSSSGYSAWATANGVSGAWNATDTYGIANVFRYAFNKPTGAFTEPVLLDITFNAAGKAVIKTPPLVNTTGFTFTIVASDNLDGTGTAASYGLNASGETTIDETGKTKRFFRLRAVEQ